MSAPKRVPSDKYCFTVHSAALNSFGGDELSSARLGTMKIPSRNQLETPNLLGLTSRGVVPHLTPDVLLEHTDLGGVHLALEDYIERASKSTPPVMHCPPGKSTPLHNFTALPPSIVTLMAPRRTPAVLAPNGNTDSSIFVFTSVGFQTLSASQYSEYINTLRPDLAVALGDVSYGNPPGVKRIAKMADRTSMWLDNLIRELENETGSSQTAIFAPILAADFQFQFEYFDHLADDVADSISGLAFYSSSLLPEIPATSSLSRLPRLSLDEPSSPHHILRQVSLGMDLFTIPFVGFATDEGLALAFQFPGPLIDSSGETNANPGDNATQGFRIHPLAIDLLSPSLATSLTPLLHTCPCYTCTSHHRAYVQHLLAAKEMLGWVLLQIHNHSIISLFFDSVRAAIRAGNFEEARKEFEASYDPELPVGTGQKPRARGYHFRSEGPGEKKRNKPAWGALGEDSVEDSSPGPISNSMDSDENENGVSERNSE